MILTLYACAVSGTYRGKRQDALGIGPKAPTSCALARATQETKATEKRASCVLAALKKPATGKLMAFTNLRPPCSGCLIRNISANNNIPLILRSRTAHGSLRPSMFHNTESQRGRLCYEVGERPAWPLGLDSNGKVRRTLHSASKPPFNTKPYQELRIRNHIQKRKALATADQAARFALCRPPEIACQMQEEIPSGFLSTLALPCMFSKDSSRMSLGMTTLRSLCTPACK